MDPEAFFGLRVIKFHGIFTALTLVLLLLSESDCML